MRTGGGNFVLCFREQRERERVLREMNHKIWGKNKEILSQHLFSLAARGHLQAICLGFLINNHVCDAVGELT